VSSVQWTMSYEVWNQTIANILDSEEFKLQIQNRGYYLSPEHRTFRDYASKTWGIISTLNTHPMFDYKYKDAYNFESMVMP
jgi:hypothetical protein